MTTPNNPYANQSDPPTQQFQEIDADQVEPLVGSPDLTLTVLYTATIFEGPETIYRYDLPAASIDEGWGSAQVVDQAAKLLEGKWPRVTIRIDANAGTTAMLAQAFQKQGAQVITTAESQPHAETSIPVNRGSATTDFSRKNVGNLNTTEKARSGPRFQLFHAAIAVVILAVCAISWWALDRSPSEEPNVAAVPVESAEPITEEAGSPEEETWDVAVAAPEFQAPPTTVITELSMRVELPAGYEVTETADDGLVTMMGNDDDFRVLMATDAIDPSINDLASLAEGVASNPRLSARPDETRVGNRDVVAYVENPSDGSTVYWYIWGEHDKRISVGCHWRFEVNPARQADCESAVQSLQII